MKRNLVSLAVLLLVAAVPATASTFVAMSLDELVAGADAVVVGHVQEMKSSWTESGRIIVTDNEVRIDEVWVGSAPEKVSVRTFGGEVGGFLVEATGFPKFEENEHVILFLKREEASGTLQVLGYQLGHLRVVERLDGVVLAVPQTDDGMTLVDPTRGFVKAEPRSQRLDQFKSRVLSLAQSQGRGVLVK